VTAPVVVTAGMSRPQREAARERIADWYAGHGHDEDEMIRRHYHRGACATSGPHRPCDAELPGGTGCLDECHDADAPDG
jgi:hypothetical protein